MRRLPHPHLAGLILCLAALAFGYFYLERALGLEPCPLCILDRILFITLAIVFALAYFQRPNWHDRMGYNIGALIISLVAVAVAARHVYLQNRPVEGLGECGAGFWHWIDQTGIEGAIAQALQGSGDCGAIQWTFLGLSIPAWTLGIFILLALLSLYDLIESIRRRHEDL